MKLKHKKKRKINKTHSSEAVISNPEQKKKNSKRVVDINLLTWRWDRGV